MAGSASRSRTITRSQPLKAKIADILREDILSGRYPLGAQLSEKIIGEELGVSRTPIREAILLLQNEGLVFIQPQSGTFVFKPSREEITHLCKMRIILESAAIQLATEAQDEQLFAELRHIVAEAKKHLSSDLEKCHRLDTQFHRVLIEASANPFLIDAYKIISDRMHALRQLLPLTRKRISAALKQHQEILSAIQQSDTAHAEQLIRDHIDRVEHMLLEHI